MLDPDFASNLPGELQGLLGDLRLLAAELVVLVDRLVALAVFAIQWLLQQLLALAAMLVGFLRSIL